MFDAVYARPDDDEVRAQLAKKLKGDPRGDFIALQLSPKRSAAEKALLQKHAKAWLQPLEDALVASTVKWERGFPVAGRINLMGRWWKQGATARPTALATLRRLDLGSANLVADSDRIERLLLAPHMRSLREVRSLPRHLLSDLAVARPPFLLERIFVRDQGGGGLDGQKVEQRDRKKLHASLVKGKGLPRLLELQLPWSHGAEWPKDYAWLWQSATGKKLETLRLPSYYFAKTLIAWHEELSAKKSAGLALKELELSWGQFEIVLQRSEKGWRRLTGSIVRDKYGGARRELDELLAKLGKNAFAEIAIDGY